MKIFKLDKFADSRGWSLNDIYANADFVIGSVKGVSPHCKQCNSFQVNYSVVNPGIIKAWHRHKCQDDYFCIVKGMAQVGVYNPKTKRAEKFFIGEHNPCVVRIDAGEWHGLTPIGDESCGLLYFVTCKYDPQNPDEERASYTDFVDKDWWKPENK
jgi:dTDP-4-dehydrorhamnose 3,5-epimerase